VQNLFLISLIEQYYPSQNEAMFYAHNKSTW